EHAALMWSLIREHHTGPAAWIAPLQEAGHMSAPDDAPRSASKIPLALGAVTHAAELPAVNDSHYEFMRLEGRHEQAEARPLPHNELVSLQRCAPQARVVADLAGQGDGLARAT